MNESIHRNSSADSFSFNRVNSLFLYYSSSWKKQLAIYFGVSVLFSVLLLIPGPDGMRSAFFSLAWTIMQWMWFLAPISMAGKGRSGIIDRLLPIKASEFLVFFILYFMIIIPAALFTLPISAELITFSNPDGLNEGFRQVLDFQINSSWVVKIINLLSGWCTSLACLYFVLKSHHNKTLFGIIAAFIAEMALGIMGAILGGYKAFAKGFEDGYNCKEPLDEMSTLEFTNSILQPSPATFIVVAIIAIATIVFITLIYRRLRYKKY